MNWLCRALGMRVGSDVIIDTTQIDLFDHVQLEDGAVLSRDCKLANVLVAAAGHVDAGACFVVGHVAVGRGAIMGYRSLLPIGCAVPPGKIVPAMTKAAEGGHRSLLLFDGGLNAGSCLVATHLNPLAGFFLDSNGAPQAQSFIAERHMSGATVALSCFTAFLLTLASFAIPAMLFGKVRHLINLCICSYSKWLSSHMSTDLALETSDTMQSLTTRGKKGG
jgi:hypothetical protein